MQDANAVPHSVWEILRIALGALLGVGGTLLGQLLTRNKTAAEVRKTEAETRHIALTDQIAEGNLLKDLMVAGAQAVLDVDRLRRQEEFQHGRADRAEQEKAVIEAERNLLQLELDKYIKIGKGNGKSTS